MTLRRTSWLVLGVALVGLVVVAALRIPWHPVPGGTPPAVSATSQFTPTQIARAEEFARWSRVWSWGGLVVALVGYGLLAGSARLRGLVTRLPGPWWLQVVQAVVLVDVAASVLRLPLDVAMRVHLRHGGLTEQGWGGFAVDRLKGIGVGAVMASLGLLVVLGAARRWRRAWPAVAGALMAGLVLAGSFVYPVVVEPVFNRFTPLPDSPLRTAVLQLAEREHVHVDDVLVADASRRTTTLNAYVSGFGNTRRVVLYDTLIDDLPQQEVLVVVAHELAHARHDDVLVSSVLGAFGAAAGIGLVGLVLTAGPFRRRVPEPGSPAVVPVLLALLAAGTLLSSPGVNLVSRAIETRADVDSLEATRDGVGFVTMQRALALHSLADPTPPAWSQFCFGSHPTVLQRIAIAEKLLSAT
ncbi:MAG: M48 family metallopeptidase [Nocardioidaceae bacterium]